MSNKLLYPEKFSQNKLHLLYLFRNEIRKIVKFSTNLSKQIAPIRSSGVSNTCKIKFEPYDDLVYFYN